MVRKYIEVHLKSGVDFLPGSLLKREPAAKKIRLERAETRALLDVDKKPLEDDDDDRRYHCSKCTKSYKNKRHLQRHQKEECIDVEPRFKCDFCHNVFRRKYHLSRHVLNKHAKWFFYLFPTTGPGEKSLFSHSYQLPVRIQREWFFLNASPASYTTDF